jgi:16S rRNA (adenine1518-N6/adenine1519-N6)-dimethyltransferase
MPNIPAKKSLGQNWLVNTGVLDRIIAAARIEPHDTVLEVGPGKGALTERLAVTGAHVIAVEKDRRLIETLREIFSARSNVEIIEADILEFEPGTHNLDQGAYKLVANIPYYLTSHLIRLVLEQWPAPKLAVLMVQREVARRIMAQPPDMNLLALSVQSYAKPSLVMNVSRGSFRPIPDVDSAVIILEPLPNVDRPPVESMLALAKQAFSQKRKQLGSTFPPEVLRSAGIDPKTRPQELSPGDWERLRLNLL